jgi:geranylgeranyl pyrophosphate synthase
MDIFSQLVEEFSILAHVKDWEELKAVFRRAAAGRPKHWLLPLRACESVGGDVSTGLTPKRAHPAMLAVACGHIGIILVDDMLDDDPRGVHVNAGMTTTANMASALQAAAGVALSKSGMNQTAKLRAMETVNAMFLSTALGQHWDVKTVLEDEETYWKIARAKSSPFFSTAFELGALAGGAPLDLAAQFEELGVIYGEMIQIHDDLDDSLAAPAKPDWNAGRASLPILFAQAVDHPKRSRFEKLRPHVCEQAPALEEAQQILIECGAVSYCVHELILRYDRARELISGLKLERRDVMGKIFEDAAQPVLRLLEEADATP